MKDPVLLAQLDTAFHRWITLCRNLAVQEAVAESPLWAEELQWLHWRQQWVGLQGSAGYVQQVIADIERACEWLESLAVRKD